MKLTMSAKESMCWKEIEKCVESLANVNVCDESGSQQPKCIVDHPGFAAVCLNRWSLEIAADNFKTRGGHRYNQTGSKER